MLASQVRKRCSKFDKVLAKLCSLKNERRLENKL